ncbi:MAG: hypothetical protein HY709_10805 [Candidatus Latescibacteria bacterium]|nr:hypothetical protein [Candidatus Latescibacterota bacterium]
MKDDFTTFQFEADPFAWYGVKRFSQWKRLEEIFVGKGTGDTIKIIGRCFDVYITDEVYREKHGKYMMRLHCGDHPVPVQEVDL